MFRRGQFCRPRCTTRLLHSASFQALPRKLVLAIRHKRQQTALVQQSDCGSKVGYMMSGLAIFDQLAGVCARLCYKRCLRQRVKGDTPPLEGCCTALAGAA